MNFETNYLVRLPKDTLVKKIYFEGSPYARILKLSDGSFYVHKVTTGVYFKAVNYFDAKGLRLMISNRCRGIDRELESDRS